jgi:DUF971 family protein
MPNPTEITLRRQSRLLEIGFDNGARYALSCEYLRVHSPSAEVRGHGPGQEVLQVNKETVGISRIEPVGEYALRLHFDDGHNSGLYTWDYLYELGSQHDTYWRHYLERLAAAGYQRQA